MPVRELKRGFSLEVWEEEDVDMKTDFTYISFILRNNICSILSLILTL